MVFAPIKMLQLVTLFQISTGENFIKFLLKLSDMQNNL